MRAFNYYTVLSAKTSFLVYKQGFIACFGARETKVRSMLCHNKVSNNRTHVRALNQRGALSNMSSFRTKNARIVATIASR